jgi:hypothetical protein
VFEGKCLKDGWRDGAEASIPVRLAQSSSPGVRLSAGSALAVSQFGSLRRPGSARSAVYCLTAYCRIQKARGGFSGAGLSLATMKLCR